jgi:zinc transporter ZupT
MPVEATELLRVITLAAFAGGTSFLGALLAKYIRFKSEQILFLTSFGAGILISAAIFEMVVEWLRMIVRGGPEEWHAWSLL